MLPGRTENSIKNYFYSTIRRIQSCAPLTSLFHVRRLKKINNMLPDEKFNSTYDFSKLNLLAKLICKWVNNPGTEMSSHFSLYNYLLNIITDDKAIKKNQKEAIEDSNQKEDKLNTPSQNQEVKIEVPSVTRSSLPAKSRPDCTLLTLLSLRGGYFQNVPANTLFEELKNYRDKSANRVDDFPILTEPNDEASSIFNERINNSFNGTSTKSNEYGFRRVQMLPFSEVKNTSRTEENSLSNPYNEFFIKKFLQQIRLIENSKETSSPIGIYDHSDGKKELISKIKKLSSNKKELNSLSSKITKIISSSDGNMPNNPEYPSTNSYNDTTNMKMSIDIDQEHNPFPSICFECLFNNRPNCSHKIHHT